MKHVVGRLVSVLCAAALAFVVIAILVPAMFGMQRYVITGGSMTGAISKGSVVYSKVTPVGELKVGDIITFRPPGQAELVTHRIITIKTGPDGKTAYRTKGDFNEAADPWNPVTLDGPVQARYVFHIPLFGYLLAALAMRTVRLALIGLPSVLIALSLLWSLWRQAGEDVAGQVEDDGSPHDAVGRA